MWLVTRRELLQLAPVRSLYENLFSHVKAEADWLAGAVTPSGTDDPR